MSDKVWGVWGWKKPGAKARPDSFVDAIEALRVSQESAIGDLSSALRESGRRTSSRRLSLSSLAALLTGALSFASLVILVWQTENFRDQTDVARQQAKQAADAQRTQGRLADSQFISRIEISADAHGVSITNRASAAIGRSAMWLHESYGGAGHLQEFEAVIEGVPVCSTMRIPRTVLLHNIDPQGGDKAATFVQRAPSDEEAQLVLQGPSGAWYMVSDNGLFDTVPSPQASGERSIDPSLRALRGSDLYLGSGDGYTEGFASVTAGTVADTITAAEDVTGYGPKGTIHPADC